MRILPSGLFRIALAAGFSLASPALGQSIAYDISFPNAENHEARIVATFSGIPSGTTLETRMARSSPGRYASTGFGKNVYDVIATDGKGRSLSITRPDPSGWRVDGHDGTVRVSYTVWGDRTDGTFLGIDRSHAHMNMPATFMYAPMLASAPIALTIHPRTGWKVATQLVPTSDTTFTAPNTAWFLDSPTEVGPVSFRSWSSTHGGKRYTWRIALHHLGTEADFDAFAEMTRKVTEEQVAMWGEPALYDHGTYTYIVDYLPWVSGDGMEHRNSTIVTSRGTLSDNDSRLSRLGTMSHELFHSWSVERLRPKSLEPFDFDRENIADELWFGEGFTSYYGPLMIRRAGLYTNEQFVEMIGPAIDATIGSPGRLHHSAVEMSRQAPFRDGASFLDPVNPNTFLSYYTWGEVIGIALDLTLRDRYSTSLDEYMRALWRDFGRHQTASLAPARPYTMTDLRVTLGSVARDTAFANDFFRRYVEGREVPDFAPLLAKAGFVVEGDTVPRPYLGASLGKDSAGVFINWTAENGSMYQAGIANGTVVHAVNGAAVGSPDALNAAIGGFRVGDTVRLEITHQGRRFTVPMRLVSVPSVRVRTYESAGLPVTPAMTAFRRDWLESKVAQRR